MHLVFSGLVCYVASPIPKALVSQAEISDRRWLAGAIGAAEVEALLLVENRNTDQPERVQPKHHHQQAANPQDDGLVAQERLPDHRDEREEAGPGGQEQGQGETLRVQVRSLDRMSRTETPS